MEIPDLIMGIHNPGDLMKQGDPMKNGGRFLEEDSCREMWPFFLLESLRKIEAVSIEFIYNVQKIPDLIMGIHNLGDLMKQGDPMQQGELMKQGDPMQQGELMKQGKIMKQVDPMQQVTL